MKSLEACRGTGQALQSPRGKAGKKLNKHWKESNKKWLDLLNIKNVNELILNPRYYYHFQGIKIFRIDYEIFRKLKIVQSPKTFADAYYINLNTKIFLFAF